MNFLIDFRWICPLVRMAFPTQCARARQFAYCGIYRGGTVSLHHLELHLMAFKHGKATVTLVQTKNPAPSVFDHAPGFEHHLDGIKVILGKEKQTKMGFDDVAVGHTRIYGKSRIDLGINLDGLEILDNNCQSGVKAKVVRNFLIMKSIMENLAFRVSRIYSKPIDS
jgi:hypothetical protein